ncbi:unnamed protein product [Closterium sp. NIES-64]|nr:unnamed protein product [Closterium sp. NIES-64]
MARTFLICLMIVLLVAPSVFARKYPEGIGHHNRNGTRTGGHHKGGHHKSGEAGTSGLTSSKGVTAGKTCKRSSLGYKAAVDPTGKGLLFHWMVSGSTLNAAIEARSTSGASGGYFSVGFSSSGSMCPLDAVVGINGGSAGTAYKLGRAIDFEVWVDDLQLFLQCDRADGLSLFDLTSGASPAPAADDDPTVRSQWATRDAAARLAVRRHLPTSERAHFSQYKSAHTLYDAVVARYSSPATAALSRLMLPYLFPDLAAFPTVADLVTHLRTSDTHYRATLPAEGVPLPPFCPLSPLPLRPTSLVLDRSVRRLPLAGDAALARARGARARVGLAGVVEVAVGAAGGVGVAVGAVAGVEVAVAAAEAEVAVAVAVGAEAAVAAEVEAAVVEEVELVGVVLLSGAAPGVVPPR